MKLSANRLSRLGIGLSLALVAGSFVAVGTTVLATPVAANASAVNGPITANEVIARAQSWLNQGIVYNQAATHADPQGALYRTDCSGYVSMAWHLSTPGRVTYPATVGNLADIAAPITQAQLQKGDLMMASGTDGHALLFEAWTDSSHTHYNAYEFGSTPVSHSLNIPYPYWPNDGRTFKPYHYTNMRNSIAVGDFDGDGKTDRTVWRPSTGGWLSIRSSTNSPWSPDANGGPGDIPAAGDYDGDGRTDKAVYRQAEGNFYILKSSTGGYGMNGPAAGPAFQLQVPGDYDGDGKTDKAVWNMTTGVWSIRNSSNNTVTTRQWGLVDDQPVQADYDGDGRTDSAVFRPSNATWYVWKSSTNSQAPAVVAGATGDIPAAGDYDGDGKADYAVYRPSAATFYILRNSGGFGLNQTMGAAGDIPVPGDYDGDGKTDKALWDPTTGNWIVANSGNGNAIDTRQWGGNDDIPINMAPFAVSRTVTPV